MRIALVDRDAAHLRSLEILLAEQGHSVTTFRTQQDVYDSIVAHDREPPEILIMDWRVLGGPGEQNLRRLRHMLPRGCRVILLGNDDLAAQLESPGRGVTAVFPKPVDFELLRRALG